MDGTSDTRVLNARDRVEEARRHAAELLAQRRETLARDLAVRAERVGPTPRARPV